jgi:hypothetical protein
LAAALAGSTFILHTGSIAISNLLITIVLLPRSWGTVVSWQPIPNRYLFRVRGIHQSQPSSYAYTGLFSASCHAVDVAG